MTSDDDDLIWYASYGSNCLAQRFAAYLTGSRAPGARRTERGARDPRPPRDTAAFWFPSGIRFVGESRKWGGGGVAVLDHHGGTPAPGRRYLVTRGQFEDVAAHENGRERAPLPIEDLVVGEPRVLGRGTYDALLAFAPIDGLPVLTFTSPTPVSARAVSPPSAAYLRSIVRGLLEVHALSAEVLADHVMGAVGVAEGWTTAEIVALASK